MPARKRPALLLVADIFGHTPDLQALTRQFGATTRILSPYGDDRPRFASEMEAYAAFTARSGIAMYAEAAREALAKAPRPFDLAVGFSVGATALWLCLAETNPWLPIKTVLYYGSRIREHADLTPACPTRLVFAQREASFDPQPLAESLRQSGFEAEVIPGSAHGFMNPLSPGFDAELYAAELAALQKLLL